MTKKDYYLIADLLDMASDEFSNHGCNDFAVENYYTKEELCELVKSFNIHNGVTDPNSDHWVEHVDCDWLLMSFFADKLRNEI